MKSYVACTLPSCSLLVDSEAVRAVVEQGRIIAVPNLRFPFSALLIRQDRAYPVIHLDVLLHITPPGARYILLRNRHNQVFCLQTGCLPRIQRMDIPDKTTPVAAIAREFTQGGDRYYQLLTDGLYDLNKRDLQLLAKKVDGGTGT